MKKHLDSSDQGDCGLIRFREVISMVSSEKEYPGDKKARIFWFALMVGIFGVTLFQIDILEAMGREPYFNPAHNFLLGGSFTLALYSFLNSLFRAKRRICDHFYMDNYDQNIMRWDQIKNVAVEGNYLILYLPEAKVWKTHRISLSSVPDKEEFVKEIRRICEIRGIPFKEQQ